MDSTPGAFPERFRTFLTRKDFVPPWPEFGIAPAMTLPNVLLEAVEAVGGWGLCDARVRAYDRSRRAFNAAIADEPLGSDFRRVEGAELLRVDPEVPVLVLQSHIGPFRHLAKTVVEAAPSRAVGFFTDLDVPLSARPWIFPRRTPFAAAAAMQFLRHERGILLWQPDARQPPETTRAISVPFLGGVRRMSPFAARAIRSLGCRVVVGVARVRWPLERGVDVEFFEPPEFGDTNDIEDGDAHTRLVAEIAERAICRNVDSWLGWRYFTDGGLP